MDLVTSTIPCLLRSDPADLSSVVEGTVSAGVILGSWLPPHLLGSSWPLLLPHIMKMLCMSTITYSVVFVLGKLLHLLKSNPSWAIIEKKKRQVWSTQIIVHMQYNGRWILSNVELKQKDLTTSELKTLTYFHITEEVCISVWTLVQEESKCCNI